MRTTLTRRLTALRRRSRARTGQPRLSMSMPQSPVPRVGMNGTKGTRKGRFMSGSTFRITCRHGGHSREIRSDG